MPPTVPDTRRVRFGSMVRSKEVSSKVPTFDGMLVVSDELAVPPHAASTIAEVATTPRASSARLLSASSLPLLTIGSSWQIDEVTKRTISSFSLRSRWKDVSPNAGVVGH